MATKIELESAFMSQILSYKLILTLTVLKRFTSFLILIRCYDIPMFGGGYNVGNYINSLSNSNCILTGG